MRDPGRIPNSVHESRPWRIRELTPDFILEDTWALPVEGGADEFPELLEALGSLELSGSDSGLARLLWELRDRLGARFGIDRAPRGQRSLSERLPDDLRNTAGDGDFSSLPFTPLYRTPTEAAGELANQTVHGVVHLGWADEGEGRYQGQMAVYVKPRGRLGHAYMALIKPFRYGIVYPALLRQFKRAWERRPVESS